MYKSYGYTIYVEDDNGVFTARFNEIQLSAKGETEDEAIANLELAFQEELAIKF